MIAWPRIAAWLRACAELNPGDRLTGHWLSCAGEIERGEFVSSYVPPPALQLSLIPSGSL